MSILQSFPQRAEEPVDLGPVPSALERFAVFFGVFSPPVGLLIAIVVLWGRGVGWLDLGLLASLYCLTLLGITVGYHRLFTHRAFETSAPIRFLLAAFGSMAF